MTLDEKDEEISNLKLREAKLRIPTDTVESISVPRPVTVVETEKPTGTDGEAGSERSIEIIHDVPRIPLIPMAVAPVELTIMPKLKKQKRHLALAISRRTLLKVKIATSCF